MRLRSMLCFAAVCLFAAIGSAQSKSDVVVVQGINTVTFSATPVFNTNLANAFVLTLTGNVTSSTIIHADPGQPLQFIICQDATGGRTFVPPTNVKGWLTISSAANTCTTQAFVYDGTNAQPLTAASALLSGVAFPASPSLHSVPVITATNTASWKVVPDCTDSAGNHINYTQSTDVWSCGTSVPGTLTGESLVSPTSTGTDSGTEVLTGKSLGGTGSTTPTTPFNRLKANRGTTLTSSDFVISAAGTGFGSWGSTASIASVGTGATDAAGVINVSCSGTGQTGNPAVKLTFHDGAWPTAPTPIIMRGDGNSPAVPVAWFSVSTTSVTFALTGTCVAGNTYTLTWLMM